MTQHTTVILLKVEINANNLIQSFFSDMVI